MLLVPTCGWTDVDGTLQRLYPVNSLRGGTGEEQRWGLLLVACFISFFLTMLCFFG